MPFLPIEFLRLVYIHAVLKDSQGALMESQYRVVKAKYLLLNLWRAAKIHDELLFSGRSVDQAEPKRNERRTTALELATKAPAHEISH